MTQRKTLHDLVMERGYPDEVAADVLAEIEAHKTGDLILSGKSVLPHPDDALRHYERKTGKAALTAKERSQQTMIDALQQRLDALESAQSRSVIVPPPETIPSEKEA